MPEGSPQAAELACYKQRARERNESVLARVNPHLPDIALDYERDVLPLTPSGNATERHIISAYINQAIRRFEHPPAVADFWSPVLGVDGEDMLALLARYSKRRLPSATSRA